MVHEVQNKEVRNNNCAMKNKLSTYRISVTQGSATVDTAIQKYLTFPYCCAQLRVSIHRHAYKLRDFLRFRPDDGGLMPLTSETLVNSHQSTWRYNPEDSHLPSL
jgi:hypothetical protein